MPKLSKLQEYFKEKGITNKFISEKTGYSETLVGRYLKEPNMSFIKKIVKYWPEIDLNYTLKDHTHSLNEEELHYGLDNEELLDIIQSATNKLRENLSRN